MSNSTRPDQDDMTNDAAGGVPGTGLLNKSLDILQFIGETDRRLKVKDLSAKTGFSKSTLYRILSALSSRGFITMDRRDQSYILGSKFTSLAGSVSRSSELIAISSVLLKRIADVYGDNVNLGVMNGDIQQAIARWEGSGARRFASGIGERKPLFCTGLGKSLLSFQSESDRERLISQIEFTKYTDKTILTPDALRSEIQMIRARGFAIDDNEIIDGVRCVSVPIFGNNDAAIASISVTGPSFRMSDDRLFELASVLQTASRAISKGLAANVARTMSIDAGHFHGLPVRVHDVQAFKTQAMVFDQKRKSLIWADGPGGSICRLVETGREVIAWFDSPLQGLAMDASGNTLLALSESALWRVPSDGQEATPSRIMQADVFATATAIKQMRSGKLVIVSAEDNSAGKISVLDERGAMLSSIPQIHANAGIAVNDDDAIVAVCADTNAVLTIDLRADRPVVDRGGVLAVVSTDINGIALDASGDLWVSHANRWRVTCHTIDGAVKLTAPLPLPTPAAMVFDRSSSAMLVGSDRIGLSPNVLELAPLSGGIIELPKPF